MINLINIIEQVWREEDKDRKPKDAHWPSEVDSCKRAMWWKWDGTEETNPPDETSYWKMQMGNAIHTLIQETLPKHIEIEFKAEVKGRKQLPGFEYPFSYRKDGTFIDDESIPSFMELKTTFGAGVRTQKENGLKKESIKQGMMYMILEGVSRCYFPLIGRDDGDRTQFIVTKEVTEIKGVIETKYLLIKMFPSGDIDWTKEIPYTENDVLQYYRDIEAVMKLPEPPPRDFVMAIKNGEPKKEFQKNKVKFKSNWQCSYCDWKDKCWEAEYEQYRFSDNSIMFMPQAIDDQDLKEF